MIKLTWFTQVVLVSFVIGNLYWLFYPQGVVIESVDSVEVEEIKAEEVAKDSDKANSSEPEEKARVIRSTKTRVKSKILPSGGLLEQTVTTEVTETFSSTLCVPGLQKCQVNSNNFES